MSKADAVEKEHDRQRVLIQITQNLATRIRNSHAFNLPTWVVAWRGFGGQGKQYFCISDVQVVIVG